MLRLNRTAIVTGASRGIGAAIAARLAADGFNVVLNYAGRAEDAEARVSSIREAGGAATGVRANVSDAADVRALFDAAEKTYGGIDVLINNAGIMELAPIATADDGFFERHVAINLRGVFNGMREAARRMRNDGRIVSLSSSVVGLYQPTYGVYAATKAAVEAMTHVLAQEMRGRNISVNALAPGPTGTDLFLGGKPPEVVEQLRRRPPLERLGTPADIAGVVAFLVGPDGGWINGQVLRANGGII